MRNFVLIATAAVAAAFAVSPAAAQDDPFVGPRAEVTAGYDTTHADDGIAATPNTLEGVRIGGAIGYDFAIGDTFTIGAELGGGFMLTGSTDATVGAAALHATTGRDLDASIRVGARATPSTLVYVKAGYANSQFRLRSTTGATVTDVSSDEDGYRLGLGVEQMLTDRIYAKAEYRFTGYDDDVSRHQALVGLGYRF